MLTDIKSSRAPITTTPVGEKIQEKLWDDMLKEFLKMDASLRMDTKRPDCVGAGADKEYPDHSV